MRTTILIVLIFIVSAVQAQTFVPAGLSMNTLQFPVISSLPEGADGAQRKWSFSRYTGISTSVAFFKGGNATIISAPIGLQLNRRLTNNWYAFANVAVAPAYTNFNQSFLTTNYNKTGKINGFQNSRGLDLYSRASMGVMYVNDAKTFSISGSISVEKSSYPMLPYYPVSLGRPMPVGPVNR
jgi:hypothetical protein